MLRNLAIGSLLFAGVASVAGAADVFRWVDDHGGVHYSDQWVPGSEVIKSSSRRPASSSSDNAPNSAPKASSTGSAPSQQDATATKAVKQDLAKAREQQCKEAKDRYDKAIQARRIYKSPDGDKAKSDERQYLSDEEADAYRVRARQDMQDFCGNSASKPAAE